MILQAAYCSSCQPLDQRMFLGLRRWNWVCLCIIAVAGTACRSYPNQPIAERYKCDNGREFMAIRDDRTATVQVGEQTFQLTAKKSSIGDRYTSDRATLIVDQGFAAFVSEGDEELTTCRIQA